MPKDYSVTSYGDRLKPAELLKIEHSISFRENSADISHLTALPVERLRAMREESATAEQAIFEKLQEATGEWEEQAAQTLSFDKAIEYIRTPPVKHTANEWQPHEHNRDRLVKSNMVYSMSYYVYERTKYDSATKKDIPVAYDLSWDVLTNAPPNMRRTKIAGQSKKVYTDKADMEKYLNGRIKAYAHLFTEISPPIPQQYADYYKVNGQLLPGYSIEGEEPKPPDLTEPTREPEPTPEPAADMGGVSISEPERATPETVSIENAEMRIDTARQSFDMQEIQNRRFMFNPQTGTLILGRQYARNELVASHAEEHGNLNTGEPYDDFIRGWIGTGGSYENGIIHFAPPIPKEHPAMFDKGFTTLEMFAKNGANENTIIRGFPGEWEQALSNIISTENEQRKERENMNEPLNIRLANREMHESNSNDGAWLKLPATAEQLTAALARIGAQGGEQGRDYFINGVETPVPAVERVPLENLQQAGLDELNYLAARLEAIEPVQLKKLNAAAVVMSNADDIHRLIEYTHNTDFFIHTPGVSNYKQLGEDCLKDREAVKMPEAWKSAVDVEKLGQIVANSESGVFTEHGYIFHSGDEWKPVQEIPQEYQLAPKFEPMEQDTITTRAPAVATAQPPAQAQVAAITAAPFVLVSDNPRDKMKEITDKLENGIKGIFESEQYKTYLNTLSKFHNYSMNNCLLIALQKPDATRVAGFTAWRDKFKRPVIKGEKGMKIIAPAPFKTKKEVDKLDANGKPVIGKDGKRVKEEQEITVPAFTVATVFDVSQTDGEPLPELGVSELTGSVDKYKEFFAALEKTSPVPVDFEKISTGAKGYYHQMEKRIAINEGMSELQNLKTAIHEIAHARLHAIDTDLPLRGQELPDRRTREVEAESIAYTVCQHYGLDTSDYSFAYVATWSGDKELDTLKSSLDTIHKEADAIITEVDKHFMELQQDKEQTAEKPTPELQPGHEKWSEPATATNAPDNPGAPSDDINAYLPQNSKNLQEAMQGLNGEVKATLQFFIDSDIKDHGEIRPATLEMIAVQGYELRDGKLEEAPPVNGTFSIYQLKDGNETRGIRFESYEALEMAGVSPKIADYNNVYTAPLKHGDTPDRIFLEFNLDKLPEDFKGHSLSVSDVVIINRDGKETAHYVDSAGFKELPDFLPQKEQTAELKGNTLWQNYTVVTEQYPDNIVFMKVGDFYEVMGDKANAVVNALGENHHVVGRDVGLPQRVPLYGVPAHKFDALLGELVEKGFKVAVAEKLNTTLHEKPAPAIDLKVVAEYMQKQNDTIQAADPDKAQGQAAFSMGIKRLEKANERIPPDYSMLKALVTHAAQSPDLPTLKERMQTMNTEFIQHYSTAVQMTIDTGAKAEPPTAAASTRQTDPAPAAKPPAQGENVAAIEAKVKAGETINLTDLSDAIKKDKQAAQTDKATGKTGQTKAKTRTRATAQSKGRAAKAEQPSIKEQIAAGKKQLSGQKSEPSKTATKNKNNGLGD